ncbi:glycosyltransferase [Nocardia neocaledoniensis]|uniref:Glycosyltransferase involved in cell wall biosynthesis n=1 Tax=Nocardia neocaledoniensis TaxID=236511 RepID=A0A317NRY3_9NOCA|nr:MULTISPECIES: glycosyltransferase [Nocardia]PWV76508.1 glycosyltransferase involved in cell wall biosynthesis [Nocardia neocaledoniensis]UGT52795.1 glycosyltransferase [Nocardia asteroides]GEM29365.1 glycosyl transferase [Nocardia neocaledoniensis NBRC 108232]
MDSTELRIAAVVPCHNEEAAVAKVVADLKAAVPGIVVYVYDNLSTDRTAERAREAGAIVRYENTKGKGNVVRRAFADIEADVYLMIDGDDTYEASAAPLMIKTLLEGPYDHVLGVRKQDDSDTSAYRSGHETGNKVLNGVVGKVFGENVEDMLSGFRVFSRRFVKSFPAVSREFEIETELTVHSLHLRVPQTAVQVGFRDRPAGSESKLRTYRDGTKILALILGLARHERPVAFYGLFGTITWLIAIILTVPIVIDFYNTHEVARFPTLFLGFTLVLLGSLAWTAGLILDGIRRSRHEAARLIYLRYSAAGVTEDIAAGDRR